MNYLQAVKVLTKELEGKGYKCRLDKQHSHPRLYVSSNGQERHAVLSSTANYDEGNLLQMKRQDIRRDVLKHLPLPLVIPKAAATSEKPSDKLPDDTALPLLPLDDNRVFGIKVYIFGRSATLAVRIPKNCVPLDGPRASVQLLEGTSRICLRFKDDGVWPGKSRVKDTVVYNFGRTSVPFKYAKSLPADFKSPVLCARLHDPKNLISDESLPRELLQENPKTTKHTIIKQSLADAPTLRRMLDEWVDWAELEGYEPTLTVENNRLKISITEKLKRSI